MGAHLIFFIIFTLFSCIILTNQSLPWYSLRSGFQCDTNMAAVFSVMRPEGRLTASFQIRPTDYIKGNQHAAQWSYRSNVFKMN